MQFYFVEQDRLGWSHIYRATVGVNPNNPQDGVEELVRPFISDYGVATTLARRSNLTEGKGSYPALV